MKKYRNLARVINGKPPVPYYFSEKEYEEFLKLKTENEKIKVIIKEHSSCFESKECIIPTPTSKR